MMMLAQRQIATMKVRVASSAHDRLSYLLRRASPVAMRAGSNDWTVERLHRLPDDGNRYEIIAGELFVTPSPAPRHQYVADRLLALLVACCDRVGLQVISAPADVIVSSDRLARPLLVIEVQSPSTARVDRTEKLQLYRSMQIPQYWIVNAEARVVERWLAASRVADLVRAAITWQPFELFAPLEIDLAELFRRVYGD